MKRPIQYHHSIHILATVAALAGGSRSLPAATYQEEVLADTPVRYWRFEETEPDATTGQATAVSQVLGTGGAPSLVATFRSADESLPSLGTPGLLAGQPTDLAVGLARESGQWALVPNHVDINNRISPKRTIEVWLKADTVPAPGSFDAEAIAGIWEEGGGDRTLNLYLWRDPENSDPDAAELIFHGTNRLNDGPGSPWGLPTTEAIFARASVRAGEVYHVVAVLDGDSEGLDGHFILYVNGVEVSRVGGVGQVYAHGSDLRIGQGNSRYHENITGDIGSFDGVLDEMAIYNTALPLDRVQAHYFVGSGAAGGGTVTLGEASDLAAKTVAENQPVSFSVVVAGEGPFTYQWFRDGTALDGQTTGSLHLTGALADAGSYTVTVANQADQVTGGPAVLTVTPDTTVPSVLASQALAGGLNRIDLTFSEPLDPVTAAAPATYGLTGVAVDSVEVSADGKRVTLHTATQTPGSVYTLALTGLKDRSVAGNPLTTTLTLTSEINYAEIVLTDHPVRYWRFEETDVTGEAATTASLTRGADALSLGVATYQSWDGSYPELGVAGLLVSRPEDKAVHLSRDLGHWVLAPNGTDINSTGPKAKRTIEVWFQATTVPAPETTGAEAIAGIWEEGGGDRTINLYLWRDPANDDPEAAELVFHGINRIDDGPGSPWGLPTTEAIFARAPIRAGQTYHVVAVFDGDNVGLNGNLILYVNGKEAGRAGGVGQIYAHTGDVRIGQGNSRYHENITGDVGSFDGVFDELAIYNTALPVDRIEAHYYAALGSTGEGEITLLPQSDLSDRALNENEPTQFTVGVEGPGPFTYQWYRNNIAIEGATTSVLLLGGRLAEAGVYTVKVANATHETTSPPVTVSVTADTTSPAVVASRAVAGSLNEVLLDFSEPLDPVNAVAPGTYALGGGLTLLSATLSDDSRQVVLKTSTQTAGTTYTVGLTGLRDRSAAGNPLTTTLNLVSVITYADEVLADGPVRYWQFEETDLDDEAGQAFALSTATPGAPPATYQSWDGSYPELGVTGLLPAFPEDRAVRLTREFGQWASVPNADDINVAGPKAKRAYEVWFQAATVPAPDAIGTEAIAGIWEEGGTARSINLYLWRDPENVNENEAALVFHAFNNANDGAGSPWGLPGTEPIFVQHTIQAGRTYHVVAVLDGDNTGVTGSLILYVNGQEVARAGGVGQIYGHGSDNRIGQGNSLYHEGATGDVGSFDGVLDELAIYNTTLTPGRILAHYQTGIGQVVDPGVGGPIIQDVRVANGSVTITWSGGGTLEWSNNLDSNQWTSLPTATSPYTEPLSGAGLRFFRVVAP